MPINNVEFAGLEKELSATGRTRSDHLAPDIGKVYVIAITRDGCPACDEQKPKLHELAARVADTYGDKVAFTRIHVRGPADSEEESRRSKDVFGHYFYPTNLILLRTRDRGAIEYYRNVSPKMDELERNIEVALQIVAMIEKEP